MTGTDLIGELFDDAEALSAEREGLKDRQDANRDALRAFERAGKLDDDQVKKLHTYYPPRKPRGSNQNGA